MDLDKLMTTDSNFAGLLAGPERQNVEFKKSLSESKEALKSLCAMINSDLAVGTVFFGIDQDGTPCGIEPGNLDTAQKSLSQKVRGNFDPRPIVHIQLEEYAGKQILVLRAKRPPSIPYYEYDGRALIREGTENRILTISEKKTLDKRRNRDSHLGPWRCNKCGARVGQLISYTVTNEGMIKSYQHNCGGEFWPDT